MSQIPSSFQKELEQQLEQKYHKILQAGELKNDALELKIQLGSEHLKEFSEGFLDQLMTRSRQELEQLLRDIIQKINDKTFTKSNVINHGSVGMQLTDFYAPEGDINVFIGIRLEKFTSQKLGNYYSEFNQKNYCGQILQDQAGMTLADIYVAPNFQYHFSHLYTGEFPQGQDIVKRTTLKKQFYPYDETTTANDFLMALLQGKCEGYDQNGISAQKLEQARLFFILGQPGQGKTSFCYKLFFDLTQPINNIPKPVFYVRLRDLPRTVLDNPKKVIFEEIKDNLPKELDESDFSKKDLNNCILILDGLDELVMVSKQDPEVANDFCQQLQRWVSKSNCEQLQIVITSRLHYIDFREVSGEHPATFVMQLLEFEEHQQRAWVSKFEQFYPGKFTQDHLDEYTRTDPRSEEGTPMYKSLYELLRLPILLYFIAQLDQEELTAKTNRAQIYEKIFDKILHRAYQDQNDRLIESPGQIDHYRMFLRKLAFDMFIKAGWFIHKDEIQLPDGITDHLHKLLASFYFSKLDENEGAIEFLHRSLQEYLAAEQVRECLKPLAEDSYAEEKLTVEVKESILKQLAKILNVKRFTFEIGEYLIESLASFDEVTRQKLSDRLAKMLPDLIERDFLYQYPHDYNTLFPLDRMEAFCYNYWLILNHLIPERQYLKVVNQVIPGQLKEETVEHWISFLKKVKVGGLSLKHQDFEQGHLNEVYLRYANLDFANLHQASLISVDFTQATLYKANLKKARLDWGSLNEADFREADLSGASLEYAYLMMANFESAAITRADFHRALMSEANLKKVQGEASIFEFADLQSADLQDAQLPEAHLTGANLQRATLSYADLSWSTLDEANLEEAVLQFTELTSSSLKKVKLSNADLQNVILEKANLSEANLQGANLSDANLSNVKLRHTNFTQANLTKAIFEDSDLTEANFEGAILTQTYFGQVKLTQMQYNELKAQGADVVDPQIK